MFVIPLITAVAGIRTWDECDLLESAFLPVDSGFESFCNDSDFCENLFLMHNGTLSHNSSGSIPLSCDNAHEILNPTRLLTDGEDGSETLMPEIESATFIQQEWAIADDAKWRKFNHPNESWTDDELAEFTAWSRPVGDYMVASALRGLDMLIAAVVRGIMATFPRMIIQPDVEENLSLIANVSMNIWTPRMAGTKFRNSAALRSYAWSVRMMLELGLKHPRPGYLSSIAPFVHNFFFLQYRFGIDYDHLFDGVEHLLTALVKLHPRYTHDPWYLRLPPGYLEGWPLPEYPVVRDRTEVDWTLLLEDSGIAVVPGRLRIFSLLQAHLRALSIALESNDDYPQRFPELERQIGVLMLVADRTGVVVSLLCKGYPEVVAWAFLMNSDTTLRLAILGRCKAFIDVTIRIRMMIRTIAARMGNSVKTRIWVYPPEPALSLISLLTIYDIHAFGGELTISWSDITDSAVAGDIVDWLGEMIKRLFSSYLVELVVVGNCTRYRRSASLVTVKRLRAVGRLLALYLRAGNKDNVLGQYLRSCSEDDTVSEVLFLNSAAVMRGFHDIFVPGDFELALIDGEEVVEMLALVANATDDPLFATTGSIRTQ